MMKIVLVNNEKVGRFVTYGWMNGMAKPMMTWICHPNITWICYDRKIGIDWKLIFSFLFSWRDCDVMAAIDKENLYVISGDIYLVSFVALDVFTKIGYLYNSC